MSTEQKAHLRPADTLRDGALKATIWENHGENGTYYTTTLARTYEDKNGKLRDTNSFGGTDLLRVAELARDAYARSNALRRELNQAHQQETAPQQRNDDYRDDHHEVDARESRRETFRKQRSAPSQGNGRAERSQGGNGQRLPDRSF